jgi:tetratricopeptide (TPR) repeat protein
VKADGYWPLGNAIFQKGLPDEAIAAAREAVRLEPKSGVQKWRLGSMLYQCGSIEEAFAIRREAIRLDHSLTSALVSTYLNHGRWEEAMALMNVFSNDPWAILCFYRGDRDAYLRACHAMLNHYQFEDKPLLSLYEAADTARACALAPDFIRSDVWRVMQLVNRKPVEADPPVAKARFDVATGMVEYRLEHFKQAIEAIARSTPAPGGTPHDALAFSVLAMARQRQGDTDLARAALADAQRILAKMPDTAKGQTFKDDWKDGWKDWLYAKMLCREAEQVLKGAAASTQKSL